MSISQIAGLCAALTLGACSQKYSFDDWPDASHLLEGEELPELSEELLQGMRAADDFVHVFFVGGPEEDQYATWLLLDAYRNETLDPKASPDSLPSYVQEACSRFLAWSSGEREGLPLWEDYVGDLPFIVLSQTDFPFLLELYREQPEIREAWYHLAQVHWNQGNDVLQDIVPFVIWKALAEEEVSSLSERREWQARYPIDRRANYLRLARAVQDWMGFWPTAPPERLDQRFPDGLPTEENKKLVAMMEQLLAQPVPGHGEPALSAEDLAWLQTTEFYLDLDIGMQCLGSESWLPWMLPEEGN